MTDSQRLTLLTGLLVLGVWYGLYSHSDGVTPQRRDLRFEFLNALRVRRVLCAERGVPSAVEGVLSSRRE